MKLLTVNNLNVKFTTADGFVYAVNDINFTLEQGKTLGIVGESGSGKSQAVLAMMGLLAQNGQVSGEVLFNNKNLLQLNKMQLNKIRGNSIAMIFQDPMTSLNPYLKISTQMTEVLMLHKNMNYKQAKQEAIKVLDAVKIPQAINRINHYPHEFSGGMRQRVMIAMALLCNPQILIADEPTTALDVTVQAQILKLLQELQKELHMAVILITHDMGVVAGNCDDVLVMYAGNIAESGTIEDIFYRARHPYTQGLLRSLPKMGEGVERLYTIPGNPPNLIALPEGCPFQPRCEHAMEICKTVNPDLETVSDTHKKACHWEGRR